MSTREWVKLSLKMILMIHFRGKYMVLCLQRIFSFWSFNILVNLLFVKFLVGGEVSVAGIQFLIVSLANVSLILDTFYNIYLIQLYL